MQWLEDLMDEYPTKTKDGKELRSESALVRLGLIFNKNEPDIMQAAVDEYLLNEKFFPRVATLKPYIDWALEQARGVKSYRQLEQDGQLIFSDEELLKFEQERGTMPAGEAVGSEWLEPVLEGGD